MFKNREVTVRMDKIPKNQAPEPTMDPNEFEKKVAIVISQLERVGKKVVLGVCAYVVLDTFRRVAVAKAEQQPQA